MLNIAIWGAAGNMGTRAVTRLRENPKNNVICVEVIPAAVEKLAARGDQPTPAHEAARIADVVVLAIADRHVQQVAADLVPRLKKGAMVVMLDPAAGYADILPKREDITYFVTHPAHPPVFNDETEWEARRDFFGAGKAKQAIVCALMQGPESDYARGEDIARQLFSPILRSHRITLEQMAMLEPAMSETCGATFVVALRDALDEVVQRGVPREAAWDFMLGHINIQLAILFEQIDWKMSDGAYLVIREGMKDLLQPDWKKVFEREAIKQSVRKIVNG